MFKTTCFCVCVACVLIAALLAILAVWGAVSGETTWRAIVTLALLAGTAGGLSCIYAAFFPEPKPQVLNPKP